MAVSRNFVIDAYINHLARHPESEDVIAKYMDFASESKVLHVITRSKEYFRKKLTGLVFDATARHKILIIGNCQVSVIGKLIEAMSAQSSVISIGLDGPNSDGLKSGNLDLSAYIADCDLIVIQNFSDDFISKLSGMYSDFNTKAMKVPAISYTAFHPDMGYINNSNGGHVGGPTGDYHSMIAFWSWANGLSPTEAIKLYRYDVFKFLGYFEHKQNSYEYLNKVSVSIDFRIQPMLSKWLSRGCFMHSINHPKIYVLADISRYILDHIGITYTPDIENYMEDDLASHPCWGVYPEICQGMVIEGHYLFKQSRKHGTDKRPAPTLTLEQFVHESFAHYDTHKHLGMKPLVYTEAFSRLANYIQKESSTSTIEHTVRSVNPYAKLKRHQLWRRGIEATPPEKVDPVVSSTLNITRSCRVATAGSCFAQHISRTLSNNDFNYYVAENGSHLDLDEKELSRLNYGVFSARYGNIYTSRQLIQLFDRAFGKFKPMDNAWIRKDGLYVDPFRPMIEPDGYQSVEAVIEDRKTHLLRVREMFETLDVFVFTLGLTESWRRREDGAVFPLAPGVAAGSMDDNVYEFVNFETHEVVADLEYFLTELSRINPTAKVIFTVSPVPLVATYENRHVLTSTTYSKSALRSAADYIVRRNRQSAYFPSYEIITGNYIKSAYYDTDLRSVRDEGVAHVMRLFMTHYSTSRSANRYQDLDNTILEAAAKNNAIVCEEEALDQDSK